MVEAKAYDYESEQQCDANMQVFLDCIDVISWICTRMCLSSYAHSLMRHHQIVIIIILCMPI